MAEGARDERFFHIPQNFVGLVVADLALFAVEKSGSKFITAPLANPTRKGDFMRAILAV